jgi:predicted secreted protein
MGSCNLTQNERSGRDMLLKICANIDVDIDIAGTDDDPQALLATAHGLVVGDMVEFDETELGTISDVVAGQLYFVVDVPDADSFKISATPSGTAITFTDPATAMEIEVFKTIGGLRTSSMAFASEAVEISNHGSNEWRQVKNNAGFRTVSISGDGVYTAAANYRQMELDAFSNKLVCLAFLDVSAGRVYSGCFKVVSLEASGEYNGEATFSMSAESADETKIYQAS